MKVQLAVVADQANVSVDGKLNIMGVFNSISVTHVPAVHPRMYFAVQYLTEASDRGQTRHIVLKFRDPDGIDLLGMEAQQPFPADAPLIATNPQLVELTLINFEKLGEYRFSVEIDGQEVATVPLRLIQIPAPPES